MKNGQKRFHPLAGLAVLTAAALVAVGGASLWLQSGWRAITPTLQDQIADASELTGFTLSGQIAWRGGYDLLHFTLQDGAIRASMELDAPYRAVEQGLRPWYLVSRSYVAPPQDRDALNAAATFTGSGSDGSKILSVPVERVLRMYTLQLPDNTVIRLAAGETDADTYATASAIVAPDSVRVSELDGGYDFHWNGAGMETETAWSFDPTGGSCFALGAGYGVCWEQDTLGRAPGLYRAKGLTLDEVAALPRDGLVRDREVLCASTEFGTLEPFYCPEDAQEALAGASMADGSTLLLYLNGENVLCADLVNAAGNRTDHRELTTLEKAAHIYAKLLPRTTDRDAVLWVEGYDQQIDEYLYSSTQPVIALLRTENGKFTVASTMEDKDHLNPDTILLNEAGDKMLLAKSEYVYNIGGSATLRSPTEDSIELRVVELDTGHVTYIGKLQTGAERDWARFYTTRNLHDDRYITFDTLQKDGGLLP